MEDSSMFLQWAMDTLHQEQQQPPAAVDEGCGEANVTFPSLQALREASQAAEMVQELIAEAYPTNSWSSGDGDTTDGSSVGNSNLTVPAAMDQDVWPASPNSATRRGVPSRRSGGGSTNPPVSWNFSAAAAQPGSEGLMAETNTTRGVPDTVYGSPPARRAGLKSSGPMTAPYPQDHIIAERKRREKINQRFIELSTVIPGLKKMDKATILSDATRYVKELQEKLKDMEAGRNNGRSNEETVVIVKRPCLTAAPDGDGSPLSASSGTPAASKQLPEIEVRFSERNVMVRIHCENAKSVVVKVLAEVEELNLGIIHANVMPFSACTLMITITAKVEDGLTITAEDIIGRLNSVLVPMHSSCNSPEETQETN